MRKGAAHRVGQPLTRRYPEFVADYSTMAIMSSIFTIR